MIDLDLFKTSPLHSTSLLSPSYNKEKKSRDFWRPETLSRLHQALSSFAKITGKEKVKNIVLNLNVNYTLLPNLCVPIKVL